MMHTVQTVIITLPVRDDGPLSGVEIVQQVRQAVNKVVFQWFDSNAEAQESLVCEPDVDGSVHA